MDETEEQHGLPPGLDGDERGFLVLELGELLFRAKGKEVGDVVVEPVWWGSRGSRCLLS
jgi:hypothetical protein